MGPAAECLADVGGQGANVSTLAAMDTENDVRQLNPDVIDGMDGHRARGALDFLPLAGIGIQGFAVALERRIHRRHLRDRADKPVDDLPYLRRIATDRTGVEDTAFRVGGIGDDAQPHAGKVALVGMEQVAGKFGGLAETQGQQAAGERVQRAGVAALGGVVQPADSLQGVVGGNAGGLVEQDDAVDGLPGAAYARGDAHWPGVPSSGARGSEATASSISRDRRLPRSTEAS